MPLFHHQQDINKSNKRKSRARRVLVTVFVVILIFFVAVGFFYIGRLKTDEPAPVKSGEFTEVFESSIKRTNKTDLFQFTSNAEWKLSKDESDPLKKYVFHAFRSGLVEHKMSIYFDNSHKSEGITYLLPVSVHNFARINPQQPSGKCGKDEVSRSTENYKGVSFLCYGDRAQILIGVSEVNQNQIVQMKNSDGDIVEVGFIYQNLTSRESKNIGNAETDLFEQVLTSFSLL